MPEERPESDKMNPLQDVATQEQLVRDLEQAMAANPELAQLIGQDVQAARNAISSGQPPDGALLARLDQARRGEEGKHLLQAAGGAALAAAGVSGASQASEADFFVALSHGLGALGGKERDKDAPSYSQAL